MKMKRRIFAWILGVSVLVSALSAVTAFGAETYATRGQVCAMLLSAADDYNPGVAKMDILQGYEDGQLHEDWSVTRAEALVMLRRAFGSIPEITGSNKYLAFPAETFTDIPDWARTELADVFAAGIVAGKEEGVFAPDDKVTAEEMSLFIQRMYRVFGANEKDDFYQTVNRDALNAAVIPDGHSATGTVYSDLVDEQVREIIEDVAASKSAANTEAGKIKTLYDNYRNKDARNAQGYEPLKPYLDEIDAAKHVSDFVGTKALDAFLAFAVSLNPMDSTHYIDYFGTLSINAKDMYEGKAETQKAAYLKYLKTLLTLIGYPEEDAESAANDIFNIDAQIAEASLSIADYYDVEKTYNLYTLDELCKVFKNFDLKKVFADSGLKHTDHFLVPDVGAMKKVAELLDDKNLDTLKNYAKCSLVDQYVECLSDDFTQASDTYDAESTGIVGTRGEDAEAASFVDGVLYEYVGKLYAEKYVDEETIKDVTQIITDMIGIYKERIQKLTWMSDATKEKAIKKLDTMKVKVGAPEVWSEKSLNGKTLRSYKEGGSLVENLMTIEDARDEDAAALEGTEVDRRQWFEPPQFVNAEYNPSFNDVTIYAGFLQIPGVYDKNASYEQNLGGIGFVVGHEISHAFDKSGSQYDENGNAVNWWTDEDAAAFDALCEKVADFYDGQEAAPGITVDGELTLFENTADLGALSVVTELASRTEGFDYKEMFESWAKLFMSACYRPALEQTVMEDLHSPESIRINRTLQTCDKFFETYGITEGDGMWLAPENRVSIW